MSKLSLRSQRRRRPPGLLENDVLHPAGIDQTNTAEPNRRVPPGDTNNSAAREKNISSHVRAVQLDIIT
jgi:hypothetical protein